MAEDGRSEVELTFQNDESVAGAGELIRNGEHINWKYWQQVNPTPAQAARLACFFDPMKWPGDVYAQGPIPDDVRTRIAQLTQFIEQSCPFPAINLAHLVTLLGDSASWTMREAARPAFAAIEEQRQQIQRQEAARMQAGRYLLEEAADALAEQTSIAADRWLDTLLAAVAAREIPLKNPRNVDDNLPYAVSEVVRPYYDQVHFADVNTWLSKRPTWTKARLTQPGPASDAVEGQEPKNLETASWKLRIHAEATRRWRNLRAGGANPTKRSLKDDLATWCREQGIKGETGINPSGEYIYRHVLRYWTPPVD